jgi:hypothetical protein
MSIRAPAINAGRERRYGPVCSRRSRLLWAKVASGVQDASSVPIAGHPTDVPADPFLF